MWKSENPDYALTHEPRIFDVKLIDFGNSECVYNSEANRTTLIKKSDRFMFSRLLLI